MTTNSVHILNTICIKKGGNLFLLPFILGAINNPGSETFLQGQVCTRQKVLDSNGL